MPLRCTFGAGSVRGFQSPHPFIPFGLELVDSKTSTATAAETTFEDVNFGANVPGRVIVAALIIADGGVNSNTITAFTVGGEAATERVEAHRDNATTDVVSAYIYTATPGGTSGDIVVTTSTTMAANSFKTLFVYRLVGGVEAPHDTLSVTGSNSASGAIDCPAGGAILAVTGYLDADGPETAASASKTYESAQSGLTIGAAGAATPDISWTELTEDIEFDFSEAVSGSNRLAFAAAAFGPGKA
ncbi:MAG: hypothetical protein RO009_15755 [Pseudorhodoplanes sp.]|jgi:hypothetical protein|nr:hypothetical protein [Pseudorhodoplanes sp.]